MRRKFLILAVVSCFFIQPAQAQILRGVRDAVNKADAKLRDIEMTDDEEATVGEQISAKIREKYGVAQDPQIHKYVSLVGNVLAKKSSRGGLAWQFIVLDTDGVNAFAAPGGYIHITRGALALMQSEAELAGVLAHEIAHVTRKHTLKAIQKGKLVQMGADQTNIKDNPQVLQRVVDEGYKIVLGGFGRAEELESDADALPLAAQIGYASSGLPKFLRTLEQRNKDSDQRQGLFASHPEMSERLQKLDAATAKDQSSPSVTLEARYTSNVKYQVVPIGVLSVVENAAAQPADAKTESKPEEQEKKPSRFSLSKIKNPLAAGSESKQSGAVTGSAASRGVDRERLAKGGSNPAKVPVTLTDADLAAFITEGQLKS
jgi:beta-barrel assembly-enhancing protease